MENLIEEYEVNKKKWEDQVKKTNKIYQDLQKKYSNSEKEKRDALDAN